MESEKSRGLFKFYKSYWTIAKELNDKDRLSFYEAIIERQFTGKEPSIKGLAKFAYISQKHSIDKQVKGWEDYYGKQLLDEKSHPIIGCIIQEKEKEKEKEKEEDKEQSTCFSFDDFWIMYAKSADKTKCKSKYDKLIESERQDIKIKLPIYLKTITDKKYQKNPLTYLNGKCWNDIEDIQQVQHQEQQNTENFPKFTIKGNTLHIL